MDREQVSAPGSADTGGSAPPPRASGDAPHPPGGTSNSPTAEIAGLLAEVAISPSVESPVACDADQSAEGGGVSPEQRAELEEYSGLQIYLPCVSAEGLVPVETAAALFCLLAAGVPARWLRPVVWRRPPAEALPAVQVRLPVPAVSEAALPAPVAGCLLPAAHLPEQRLCVAGLCAVVRRAIRTVDRLLRPAAGHYHQRDTGLLGFRRGTLAPPADASLMTRFVERDVPAALRLVLSDTAGATDARDGHTSVAGVGSAVSESSAPPVKSNIEMRVPPEVMKFDHHMRQPLRVHNVWKQEQQAGGRQRRWATGDHKTGLTCVRHTYTEGHVFTIGDLLLYPCLRLLTAALAPHGFSLADTAPATQGWMRAVEARPGLLQVWNQLFQPAAPPTPTRLLRLSVPEVTPESLYKKDPARYQPKKRAYTVQSNVEAALLLVEASEFDSLVEVHPGSGSLQMDWSALPEAASPADGGLPASRLQRKQQQLENLAWLAARVARPGDTIVDFCSGGGHLGLLLAVLLPQCHVVLVENKEESLKRGQDRLETLQLTNVSLYQCNMEFYTGSFQLGVALHACGVATDLVMQRCLAERAALLCCPCCYGAVHAFGEICYPRSAAGRRTGAGLHDWLVLGHAADQTHSDGSRKSEQGRHCMALVDSDRAAFLREAGYQTLLTVAEPAECSNKNHLLVAVPPGWRENGRLLAN